MNDDQEHLKLLSIFHYVVGGVGALFSCFPIIHLIIGIAMLAGGLEGKGGQAPPRIFAWLFILFPACFMLIGWTLSTCILLAGRKLQLRQSYQYCFVVACIECLFVPFGTVLGVFTILVLNRKSVKDLFASKQPLNAD